MTKLDALNLEFAELLSFALVQRVVVSVHPALNISTPASGRQASSEMARCVCRRDHILVSVGGVPDANHILTERLEGAREQVRRSGR